jgi:hypothetical protein
MDYLPTSSDRREETSRGRLVYADNLRFAIDWELPDTPAVETRVAAGNVAIRPA